MIGFPSLEARGQIQVLPTAQQVPADVTQFFVDLIVNPRIRFQSRGDEQGVQRLLRIGKGLGLDVAGSLDGMLNPSLRCQNPRADLVPIRAAAMDSPLHRHAALIRKIVEIQSLVAVGAM
jgi:hypothetical protein